MPEIEGSLLTPEGWCCGRLAFDERVVAITGEPQTVPEPPYVVPGFVDLHVHGGGGADVMAGEAAVRTMARAHAAHGTTALLATTVTAPPTEIDAALDGIEAVRRAPGAGEAAVVGAHLEGPFLNPKKLGAQPPFARRPDQALLAHWCERAAIRVMTLAPECDAEGRLLAALLARGVRPQIGHTLCRHDQARVAIAAGAGVTHLFNAMSGLDHRAPGAVGAALATAVWAEIIADLVHVEATALLAARRAIPHLYVVTDATAGAGMPDGDYPLGRHTAHKHEGVMRLSDGTLAGSTLTMDQAVRNLARLGLSLGEAVWRASTLPAMWLGLKDHGRLVVGARADIVVLDADLAVCRVLVGGRSITAVAPA